MTGSGKDKSRQGQRKKRLGQRLGRQRAEIGLEKIIDKTCRRKVKTGRSIYKTSQRLL